MPKDLLKELFDLVEEADISKLKKKLVLDKYQSLINSKRKQNPQLLLHAAVLIGDIDIIKLLIRQGANIFSKHSFKKKNKIKQLSASEFALDKYGTEDPIYKFLRGKELELLTNAIFKNNLEQLSSFIEAGADLHIRDSNGNSMAHFAAKQDRTDALKIMEDNFGQNPVYNNNSSKNKAGKTPFDVLVVRGNYFKYEEGEFLIVKNKNGQAKRPGNQSRPEVLKKLSERLKNLPSTDKNIELTPLQKQFIDKVDTDGENKVELAKLKIDIAHNIPISEILLATVHRMNSPITEDSAAEKLIDEMMSTGEDNEKVTAKEFINGLNSDEILPQQKIMQADKVMDKLNSSTRNLIPGYSSINRSIGKKRDPHFVFFKDGAEKKFKEHRRAQNIAFVGKRYIEKTGDLNHGPWLRKTAEEKFEAKSSSVHAKPTEAWAPYESPKYVLSPVGYFGGSEGFSGSDSDDVEKADAESSEDLSI